VGPLGNLRAKVAAGARRIKNLFFILRAFNPAEIVGGVSHRQDLYPNRGGGILKKFPPPTVAAV